MPRKSNTDMIATLEARLAEAKAKEASKARTRVAYLVEAIKSIKEKMAAVNARYTKTVETAASVRDAALAKLEDRLATLELELQELAEDSADTDQLTFNAVEVEEV